MGNNPVRASQVSQLTEPEKETSALALKVKRVYEQFWDNLSRLKREHRGEVDVVLRAIDERKIQDLKGKLKDL